MALAAMPPIVHDPITFGDKRVAETRAYAVRHYGLHRARLIAPKVIVEHMTAGPTYASAFNTFAADAPDVELHELPGVCSHFIVDTAGRIHQLVSLKWICRHTVGLNYTAIGIEHVGTSEAGVLSNKRMIRASLRLTEWLQAKYGIGDANVIGHAESLSSPYHRERVARLKTQTHADWPRKFMVKYRARLS
jgi:N-acetyl-anhydromuramyl-L-alanine amidase AmpD